MPSTVPQNDAAVLDDIVSRLIATGEFGTPDQAEVAWGNTLEVLFPEALGPSAAIEYLGSTETPISDISSMIRDGRYSLTLAVRNDDHRERGKLLSQLSAACRNALSGVQLAGFCQPFWCRLKDDTTATASLPEGRRVLSGTFRYAIEDDGSRGESDDD